MATTTNYGWTTPDDTALVKDGAAAIRTLGSSVDTTTKNLNPETTLGDIAYRSSTANVKTRLGIGTTGQVLTVAGGVPTWATAGAARSYAVFYDEKAQSTSGGTFTSGAWRTRDLQTTQINNITSCSLSSNQISLPAGTYFVISRAPAYQIYRHQSRFQNITDSTTAILGSTAFAADGDNGWNSSFIMGQFTIAGTKTFELQHQCSNTRAGDGFGTATDAFVSPSIYSNITIEKIG